MRLKAVSDVVLTLLFIATLTLASNVTVIESPVVHDLAILDVLPSRYEGYPTWGPISINVTVRNNGTEAETFNVTVYYNDTAIETQTITDMPSHTNITLTFLWDVCPVPAGTYIISVNISSPVLGEIRKDDGYVEIRLWGDVNDDGRIDLGDVGKIILIYSSLIPWWEWCGACMPDVNGDGRFDLGDVGKVILIYSGIIRMPDCSP